jgi:hypothetical protein
MNSTRDSSLRALSLAPQGSQQWLSCKGTHHEADCLYWDDRIGGFECTYERRVGNDFHVKYDRDSEEIRHMSLYVKGPLAELDFSELDMIEFGSRYGSGYL